MTIFSKEGNLFNAALCLTSYFDEGNGFMRPLDKEEEKLYFERLKQGDETAQNALVVHNMRLVVHISKRYIQSADPDELISIGSTGLIKAINSFDADKGIRFSTYAAKCIANEILMYLRANKKNVNNVSLFTPIGSDKEGNEITLSDTLFDEEYSVSKKCENDTLKEELLSTMKATLTDREIAVIVLRFGLFGHEKKPQREIAQLMDISRSYISRIEKKALAKMRKYLEDKGETCF